MNKQIEKMQAEYVAKVGHNRSFLKVEKDGKQYLVLNNTLVGDDGEILKGVDGQVIAALPLAQEDTVDNRLDNLAKTAVERAVPLEVLTQTVSATLAASGIDPNSEKGIALHASFPERIQAQPNAEQYMMMSVLGLLSKGQK